METLTINPTSDKGEKYAALLPQISSLVEGESYLVANLANTAAALKETFGFFWCGFYLVEGDSLVLGPFQGPVACTRIAFGHGVCGTAWRENRTIIVEDVDKFPGHIACSSASRSEIVIPVRKGENIVGVLDIDSDTLATFDQTDARFLEKLCDSLSIFFD